MIDKSDKHYETRTLLLPVLFSDTSFLTSLFAAGSLPSSRTRILCSSLNLLISMPFFVNCSFPFSMNFSSCSLFCMRLGSVSLTVCSHKTPPINRKHFLFSSTVFNVSMTVLKNEKIMDDN
jgi:hypothetical protein